MGLRELEAVFFSYFCLSTKKKSWSSHFRIERSIIFFLLRSPAVILAVAKKSLDWPLWVCELKTKGEGVFPTVNCDVSRIDRAARSTRRTGSAFEGLFLHLILVPCSLQLAPLCLVCHVCSPFSVQKGCVFLSARLASGRFSCPDLVIGRATKPHLSFTIVVSVPRAYINRILSCTHLVLMSFFLLKCFTWIFYKKRLFLCKYTCWSSYD